MAEPERQSTRTRKRVDYAEFDGDGGGVAADADASDDAEVGTKKPATKRAKKAPSTDEGDDKPAPKKAATGKKASAAGGGEKCEAHVKSACRVTLSLTPLFSHRSRALSALQRRRKAAKAAKTSDDEASDDEDDDERTVPPSGKITLTRAKGAEFCLTEAEVRSLKCEEVRGFARRAFRPF